jgi:probable F420-dependent oxidoreductase
VKLDATLRAVEPRRVPDEAGRAETLGFDGLFVTERNGDPFVAMALAAHATQRVDLGTAAALAFPRSPMELAYTAWDLQGLSGGRFQLGLATQVRAHVERRYGAVWSDPPARMREFVLALQAIWTAWRDGGPLSFEGRFYRHTLMPPAFRPADHGHPFPRVLIGGVGPAMVETAGAVADGLLLHPLHSPESLARLTMPALTRGLAAAGRSRQSFEVHAAVLVATTDAEWEDSRRRVAFYGSTPAYRPVLAVHGWEDRFEELHRLTRAGAWGDLPAVVDDEMLAAFVLRATSPQETAAALVRRYAGLADRISLNAGERSDLARWADVARHFTPGPVSPLH